MAVDRIGRAPVELGEVACDAGPIAALLTADDAGIENDRRQALERAHLLGIEIDREQHPAEEVRRQDRRSHNLFGVSADGRNADQLAGIERVPKSDQFPADLRIVACRARAVDRDDIGLADVRAGFEIGDGRSAVALSPVASAERKPKSRARSVAACWSWSERACHSLS